MRYTHAIVVISIGIIELFQLVSIWSFCILIIVYCVCMLSISIIYWWLVLILFHTHIYVLFVLLYFYILSTNLVYARAWASTIISIDLVFNWYLNILFKEKYSKVLICIEYMQGELNISSTYRFMLSVSCIEELDISSLCDTRV